MLKKRNQLVLLTVLILFVFSMIGGASASFSDVPATNSQAAAINRIDELNIIDGYPDGTFKPDQTITRAEFAKIAVYTAGLQDAASSQQFVTAPFPDVAVDYWAKNWINIAASHNYVKGYPDGTFAPEAQITQTEVITVLLRILGYNDNLPGTWPEDYITKASNLGIYNDISFVANKAATRGEVAVLVSAVLDEKVVVYNSTKSAFEEALKDGKAYTLLSDKFNSDVASDPNVYIRKRIAMVSDLGQDVDGRYALLLIPGGQVKVYLKDRVGQLTDNTLIGYKLSQNKIYEVYDAYLAEGEISSINGNVIKTLDRSFVVDEDTLYYDNTGDDPKSVTKADLGSGDYIVIYNNDNDFAADAIEIVNPPIN